MTVDAPGSAFEEAQRLLIDHGLWTTAGGAYLESNSVTVLIHPVHDAADEADWVDVVVTVRPRTGRLQLGGKIEIEGSETPSVTLPRKPRQTGGEGTLEVVASMATPSLSAPLNHRGQAVFRRLAAGEYGARLVPAPAAASPPAEATSGPVVALRRIPRLLAAAAAGERRVIHQSYTSDDGRLHTEVVETDEARLVVRISSSKPPLAASLVRIRWALEPAAMGEERTLVVPLASGDGGAAATAKYDLGSVDQAEAVSIAPAEWADPSELTEELVRGAFELSIYGSARRAWEELALTGVCAPAVERALRAALDA